MEGAKFKVGDILLYDDVYSLMYCVVKKLGIERNETVYWGYWKRSLAKALEKAKSEESDDIMMGYVSESKASLYKSVETNWKRRIQNG